MKVQRMRAVGWKRVGLLGLAAALVAGCGIGTDGGGGEKQLTFVSYGKGTYQDGQENAWLKPFEEQNGVKVTLDGPSDNAKLQSMVEAGKVTWDVMDTDGFLPRQHCGTLLDTIDVGDLKDSFPPGTLSDCGVPAALFALEFMYNDKTYGDNPPTKLADFFDPVKYPGKRVIFGKDPTIGVLEAALMGDGVAPDSLYPLDVERAFGVYNRIRPTLTFAQTYAQQQQIMVDNQADMALVVSARAYSVLNAGGTQWKPVWDQIPVTWDTLVIPKGSPNKDLAVQLIEFASQPEQAAKFAELSGAGAANTSAEPQLNDLQKQVDAWAPEHEAKRHFINADWWTEHYNEVVEKWSKWQVS